MARIEFTESVKELVASRSAYKCSYPGCERVTLGPGPALREVSRTGVAAHIYSASKGGPRGWGDLTPYDLSGPENAIWLCSEHAKLIDNNRGEQFPAPLLFEYKRLHESRIAREQRGVVAPLGWFHRMIIKGGPLFSTPAALEFGKVTLITGNNETGKTALWQWAAGIGDERQLQRWLSPVDTNNPLRVQITYFDPVERTVGFRIEEDRFIHYMIDDRPVPFQPFSIRFIVPKDFRQIRNWGRMNDLGRLSAVFGLPPAIMAELVEATEPQNELIQRLTLQREKKKLQVMLRLRGNDFDLSLGQVSSGELTHALIEIAVTLAQFSAKYMPTVLILDEMATHLDNSGLRGVIERAAARDVNFQTIAIIPTRATNYDQFAQAGAKVVWLKGMPPTVKVE